MHWSIQPSSREVTSLVRIIHRAKCSTAGLRSNSYTAKTHHSENCIAIATAIAIAMAASAALRRIMAQDPVLTACGVLSAIGTYHIPHCIHSPISIPISLSLRFLRALRVVILSPIGRSFSFGRPSVSEACVGALEGCGAPGGFVAGVKWKCEGLCVF
ncbi:hypothetical protein KC19_3G229500 [Ceratodon purpureus]|uniref:Uncharacterized protein n=1 Tax=Ceratodon purpureus TaxID=3225 RepID=A0A8T0IPG7_CERPU|nr:hypothetical protein KC19_3G229500 [Ceratodon purpureus]